MHIELDSKSGAMENRGVSPDVHGRKDVKDREDVALVP